MTVTAKEKREFIKWLLNNYAIKQREAVWILNYFASHDKNLNKLHFIMEDALKVDNGIVISTTCVKDAPFAMTLGHELIVDAETAFHHIRREIVKGKDFYLQIRFKNNLYSAQYAEVLEEHPDTPQDEVDSFIISSANNVINELEKRNVKYLIDLALDAKDQEQFNFLVGGLNQ